MHVFCHLPVLSSFLELSPAVLNKHLSQTSRRCLPACPPARSHTGINIHPPPDPLRVFFRCGTTPSSMQRSRSSSTGGWARCLSPAWECSRSKGGHGPERSRSPDGCCTTGGLLTSLVRARVPRLPFLSAPLLLLRPLRVRRLPVSLLSVTLGLTLVVVVVVAAALRQVVALRLAGLVTSITRTRSSRCARASWRES